MDSATLVSILLGILPVATAVIAYLGATRTSRNQAKIAIADIDADAYERAKGLYESAIKAQDESISRYRVQLSELTAEVALLRKSNTELKTQMREIRKEMRDGFNNQRENNNE